MHAAWWMLGALAVVAIAYRYYSAFIAARVLCLDDARITPAHRLEDGQNFHPTNRIVLFGHHFAAITGAGPLVGPVLALQFGFLPGFLWLLVGVVVGGAVHDFVILTASMRHGGRSLAEIARRELGPFAGMLTAVTILFVVVIALAGLGLVVVNALRDRSVASQRDRREREALGPASSQVPLRRISSANRGMNGSSVSEGSCVFEIPMARSAASR